MIKKNSDFYISAVAHKNIAQETILSINCYEKMRKETKTKRFAFGSTLTIDHMMILGMHSTVKYKAEQINYGNHFHKTFYLNSDLQRDYKKMTQKSILCLFK